VSHVNDAVPACAIAIAWATSELAPSVSERARHGALALAVSAVALAVTAPVAQGVRDALGESAPTEVPHFEGTLVSPSFSERMSDLAASLSRVDADSNRTVILMPGASAYYLAGGLSNPTRFDYPLVNTFGPSGQDEVIAAIRRQTVRRVCLGPFRALPKSEPTRTTLGRLRPRRLTRYVRTHMARVRELGSGDDPDPLTRCTLYRGQRPNRIPSDASRVSRAPTGG
jgi:hypothetical protein